MSWEIAVLLIILSVSNFLCTIQAAREHTDRIRVLRDQVSHLNHLLLLIMMNQESKDEREQRPTEASDKRVVPH